MKYCEEERIKTSFCRELVDGANKEKNLIYTLWSKSAEKIRDLFVGAFGTLFPLSKSK